MIEEVLKKISESEAAAEKIKAEGEAKALSIRFEAEKKAKELRDDGESKVRVKRLADLQKATKEAADSFSEHKSAVLIKAENFKTEKSGRAEELAEELYRRMKDGDC